ncbi:MAG: hypothetical protein JO159_11385 [Acidobacteria bacterium]|nr:hypothetical protein [Acidobacteriota bacterium]MBV9623548.1 hypothetical protein [Acidobacteriota bacterium]
MAKLKLPLTFVVALVLASTVAAQQAAPALKGTILDGTGLPGQAWTTIGNLSPIEHDGYFQSYIEQSSAVFASRSGSMTLSPYASLGLVFDTQGYEWNNQIEPRVGIKLNRFFRSGVASIGSAYALEDRFNGLSRSGLVLYAQDWFGWQPVTGKGSRFPGSTWAAVGNISPAEQGNIIGQVDLSQGIVAKKLSKTTLVPYGEFIYWRDSKHFDWDNKLLCGTGIKAVFPRGDLYSELGAAYFHENRFASGRSAGGLTLFMNVSFAWNLLGRTVARR